MMNRLRENRVLPALLWSYSTVYSLYNLYNLLRCCEPFRSLVQLAVALDDHQEWLLAPLKTAINRDQAQFIRP